MRQFHDAEVRAEMPAVFGQHGDQLLPDFFGQFLKLRQRQFLDVRRFVHHVEVSAHKLFFFGQIGRQNGFNFISPAAVFSNC